MDQLEDFKDKETIKVRPTRLHALLHLFLLCILFIGFVMFLSAVAIGLASFFVDIPFSLDGIATSMEKISANSTVLKVVGFISSSLPLIVTSVIVAYFAQKQIGIQKIDYLSFNKPRSWKWFCFAILFVVLSVPLMGFFLELNESIVDAALEKLKKIDVHKWQMAYDWLITQEEASNKTYESMVGDGGITSFVLSLLFMAILPAISEEMFFRGALMNGFNGLFRNMHVSIVLTSIIFSLIHMQFMKVIPMFFLAVVFGYAAYWTGTIWTSITAHFANNALAVYQLYFVTDGDYDKALDQGSQVPMYANIILFTVTAIIFYIATSKSNVKIRNLYV